MRRYSSILAIGSAILLVGCSAESVGNTSRDVRTPMPSAPVMAPMTPTPAGTAGGFANPLPITPQPANTGAPPAPMQHANCRGGVYLGSYNCNVNFGGIQSPLEGEVAFTLEIDETIVPGECDVEFCPNLVIAEGSGTLFGFAGLIGFEAMLDGGLDCQTGEFRASAPDGIYGGAGPSDPNDPDAIWTVDSPFGMFTGTLSGMHGNGPPERIMGDWDLADTATGINCPGPFMVALQP